MIEDTGEQDFDRLTDGLFKGPFFLTGPCCRCWPTAVPSST